MMKAETDNLSPVAADTPDPEDLAAFFIRAFPKMDADEQRLALTLYRCLAEGAPVAHAELAGAVGRPPAVVEERLRRWPGVFHDDAQRVTGFWGLSVSETRHRLEVDGKTAYAWCAWDTLFIPALLGATARVSSPCAATSELIRLTISPRGIETSAPEGIVVSFLLPDEGAWRENIVTSFCHHVYFFRSRTDAGAWIASHPNTFLLSLDQAFRLAQAVNRGRYDRALLEKLRS